MSKAPLWQHQWDAEGLHLTRASDARELRFLSHAEIAQLSDYEAVMLGLPRHMEAMMAITVSGRIDRAAFKVECRLEPLTQPHPWAVYRREGARLFVGQRQWRLNSRQLALFIALERMDAAGSDVAARLQAWPQLAQALHVPTSARILVQGYLPHLHISTVPQFSAHAMTRVDEQLVPAQQAPWAMLPRRRYAIRAESTA